MPSNTQETTSVVNSVNCDECGDAITDAEQFFRRNMPHPYCEQCFDEHQYTCDECSGIFDERDMTDGFCDECWENRYSEDDEGVQTRMYSTAKLPAFMSKEQGKYITSERVFSAEIECYYRDSDDGTKAVREVAKEYGVETDGSLSSYGLEFQTPMLQGLKGEQSIIETCAILNKRGFYTDSSTGLHIHLDGKGLIPKTRTKHEPTALAQAFMFYISFEDVLMSFLPPSRRANRYCMSLRSDYHAKEISRASNLEALEKIWYRASKRADLVRAKEGKYHDSRYFGLNLHSLLKDGHVEVRFHSGTLNAVKILEWANLHQTILDKAVGTKEKIPSYEYRRAQRLLEDGITTEIPANLKQYQTVSRAGTLGTQATQASNLTSLAERTQYLFELLELPERACQYFLERQNTFTSTAVDNDEDAQRAISETIPCAA